MSLAAADFVDACRRFEKAWQSLESVSAFSSCRVIDANDQKILRLQRCIDVPLRPAEVVSQDEDVSEVDNEALSTLSQPEEVIIVTYDVTYSASYQCPVLYLRASRKSSSAPLSVEKVLGSVVGGGYEKSLGAVGVMGAVTLADHVVYGTPAYMVHPCKTQEAMEQLFGQQQAPLQYLLSWIGLIGNPVGLTVPIDLVMALQSP